jgi:hypothetical protein
MELVTSLVGDEGIVNARKETERLWHVERSGTGYDDNRFFSIQNG